MKKSKEKEVKDGIEVKETNPNIDTNLNPNWTKRVLIFTPTRGTIRMEWAMARYGQIIPTNWSFVDMRQFLSPYVPMQYQLADAQNLLAKKIVEDNYEWVIYIEDDNLVPECLFLKLNEYINEGKEPVVSGLYWTKSNPAEPVLYRGRGNSYYGDWKVGDKVRVDGIPFGCRLEHAGLIKVAWENSPEYFVGNQLTRRVFEQPSKVWYDEEKGGMVAKAGTTDLAWCTRIKEEKLLEKAGFKEHQKMEFPYLVDTTIFVRHIDPSGKVYPDKVPMKFIPQDEKGRKQASDIIRGKYVR